MPRHIEQRRLGWYAVLNVPTDAQKSLRRKRYRVSLKTRDKKVAERLAKPIVAEWQRQIALARGEGAAMSDAKFWRDALRRSKTPEDRMIIETNLETHVLTQGLDNTDPEAQRFYGEAFGTLVSTTEYLEEWIGSPQVKNKTARMRRATIGRLADKFPMLNDVSRKEVRRWATEIMAELKPATVQRMMTDCRTYWTYLATIEAVPEESAPFNRLRLKVKSTPRIPWSPEDLVALHCAAEAKNQILADLIKLAMYSGARLGELVNLRVADVAEDHYRITSSKTEAGVRVVPIHREVQQTMARLIEESRDGYVLSGITGKNRAATMSKAFQRLRKEERHTDKRQVFHSIRNTVITILERAGVPEGTVQDIVGHERSTLTGSTYSGKSTLEMWIEALDKLAYIPASRSSSKS